jgi:hypothetical protein
MGIAALIHCSSCRRQDYWSQLCFTFSIHELLNLDLLRPRRFSIFQLWFLALCAPVAAAIAALTVLPAPAQNANGQTLFNQR